MKRLFLATALLAVLSGMSSDDRVVFGANYKCSGSDYRTCVKTADTRFIVRRLDAVEIARDFDAFE